MTQIIKMMMHSINNNKAELLIPLKKTMINNL